MEDKTQPDVRRPEQGRPPETRMVPGPDRTATRPDPNRTGAPRPETKEGNR